MADLRLLLSGFDAEIGDIQVAINGHAYANSEVEDTDLTANALHEGFLLRAFTSFESSMEATFLHFATGGASLAGFAPVCRLTGCTESQARDILRGNQRFLDWSHPKVVRERADLIFADGEPFRSGIDPHSQVLSDIQKIRNAIAHDSPDAASAFGDVVLSNFQTPRLFAMSPGQLLRVRRRKRPYMSWGAYYLGSLGQALRAVVTKE